ncbi:MAG: hypothetical protein AAF539_02065 [Planctomycetota bacterium]
MKTIRYIESSLREDQDLTDVFSNEHLDRLLYDLLAGLRTVDRLVVQTGIADEIQNHYESIVERLEQTDFPEADVQLLRDLGFETPEKELVLMIHQAKRPCRVSDRPNDGPSLDYSHAVRTSIETLEGRHRLKNSGEDTQKAEKPKRKGLKGLGPICKGSAITIVDVGLLGGFWNGGGPAEAIRVGATVSIAAGLNDILRGAGELRGE